MESTNAQDFVNAGKCYVVSTGGSAGTFDCPSNSGMQTFIDTNYSANMLGRVSKRRGGKRRRKKFDTRKTVISIRRRSFHQKAFLDLCKIAKSLIEEADSLGRKVGLSDTCSWFSIDRLGGYLVLIESWVMHARDEPEMIPRRRLYPTLGLRVIDFTRGCAKARILHTPHDFQSLQFMMMPTCELALRASKHLGSRPLPHSNPGLVLYQRRKLGLIPHDQPVGHLV
jgi:hypothetical protein